MKTFLFLILVAAPLAHAKLKVVASTADIGALVSEVGSTYIELEVIAKGTQDPHAIEPKPSYMVKMNGADLVVSNGLSLETGWLPSLIRGARNPKVMPGSKGYLDLGSSSEPIEVATGGVTRAMGDVHPDGNPHYTLDPVRTAGLADVIAARLSELDPGHKMDFDRLALKYKTETAVKVKAWQERVAKSGVSKVVTYHPSLNYFLQRFKLNVAGFLEPKPGIPPTAQHILEIISVIKSEKVPIILIDNFYDSKIGDRISNEVPGTRVRSVGISVGSAPGLERLSDVTEQLVKTIEEAGRK